MINFSYCRVFDPIEYELFSEHNIVDKYLDKFKIFRYEHPHRRWEYGLALKLLLDSNNVYTILDIGGGGSILAPILADHAFKVTVLDLEDQSKAIKHQNEIIHTNIEFIKKDWLDFKEDKKWDAVISISTIEHIEKYTDTTSFWLNMINHSSKLVFLTTDFHPSQKRFSYNHWRTFNNDDLLLMCNTGIFTGFKPLCYGFPKWNYLGNYVYEYTFASLGMETSENIFYTLG